MLIGLARLVRTAALASCIVCAGVQAQSADADTNADAARRNREAVPVNRSALISPNDLPKPVSRPIDADPLFVPGAVLVGTGAAALLASLLTGMGAHSKYSSLEKACPNDVCSSDLKDRIDSGKTLALVSTVLTGVGVGAAAVGTALLIIAAVREDEPPKPLLFGIARLRLTQGPGLLGLGASGSF